MTIVDRVFGEEPGLQFVLYFSAAQSFRPGALAALGLGPDDPFPETGRSVADELLGVATEQLRLSHIRIDTGETDGESPAPEEGEVHYSEILVAPGDDPDTAPECAPARQF